MREYLLVLLTAAALTYLLSGWCRRIALHSGAVARVRDRDVHVVPIPYFGGVAMLAGVGAAILLGTHLPFLGRQAFVRHDAASILLAAAVICAIGVVDDLVELGALIKLAGQVLAAGIVVLNGVKMYWIPLPGSIYSLGDLESIVITVFFIVLCTNAVNFVDGLDGLAAGVVCVGALAFFSYSYLLAYEQHFSRATTSSLVTVAVAGACLGFLPHNFFPARMFMGDSGAMLLGLLLAASTISLTGQIDPSAVEDGADRGGLIAVYLPLVLPLAILALPLLDVVLAWFRRANRGQWWFKPDKKHLHHQMMELGHSMRGAVLLMYLWSALVSFGVIFVGLTRQWWSVAVVLGAAVVMTLLTLGPRHRRRRGAPAAGPASS